jgi:hypothetical protein
MYFFFQIEDNDLRIDGKEELALVRAYPARIHTLH